MRQRTWLPLVLGLLLVSTGCAATHHEWEVWRAHPTHFATDNHLGFSMSRLVGAGQVTPEVMDRAKAEGWWGRNSPLNVAPANVGGRWQGFWSAYGMSRTLRSGIAQAEITVNGASGQGRLALIDARVAEGVPAAVREASSFGAPIEVSVSDNGMWVNGTEASRPFAATFILQGDKLVGQFIHTGSPVRIELTRLP